MVHRRAMGDTMDDTSTLEHLRAFNRNSTTFSMVD
jgi:hypothetical protein